MILINFGHPLSEENVRELERELGGAIERVLAMPVHFDPQAPFAGQVVRLVDGVGLTPRQWQREAIVINPPALNVGAVALLAELHGRLGYFPPVLRLRPGDGVLARRYQVAEVIDLRALRDTARKRRAVPEVEG